MSVYYCFCNGWAGGQHHGRQGLLVEPLPPWADGQAGAESDGREDSQDQEEGQTGGCWWWLGGGCTHPAPPPPSMTSRYSSYLGLLGGKGGAGPGEEARLHQPQSDRVVAGADRGEEWDKGRDKFGGERGVVGRVCGQVTGSSQRGKKTKSNLKFGTENFLKAILFSSSSGGALYLQFLLPGWLIQILRNPSPDLPYLALPLTWALGLALTCFSSLCTLSLSALSPSSQPFTQAAILLSNSLKPIPY